MLDLPTDPTPKKIVTQKPAHLFPEKPSATIDELLKEEEDVEVVFYYNNKRIPSSTTFF